MPIPRSFPSSNINDPYDSRDTGLDDTIESSFPASDPPSSIPDPTSDSNASYATDGASGTVERLARTPARRLMQQAARLPSDPFLWAAIGSLGVSAALRVSGKKHASLFAGQLAPVFLLLGIYNRLVEQFGPDRYDPA